MNGDTAPRLVEDDTDLAEPKRRASLRLSSHAQSRAEARRRFGSYRVIALLGEGGMAQVHLAVKHGPAGFKKLLVVKSMRDGLVDPIFVRSFMHEARLAAQLNHPNVIQTYEVGEDEGQLYIAMEYVEGQSMRAVQRRLAPKRMPINVQLRVLAEVARGLHHAHTLTAFDGTALAIVHRDVSPQNVMLTYDGQVKLLDFGIAKAHGSDDLTREGMIKGKIDYMAPEQLRGEAIDQRADVFALGVMLWEALTGRRFSGGAEVAEITKMHNRIMGREPKLRQVAPDTPMRLVEICEQALALEPKDRQRTAEDFERALVEYLSDASRASDSQQLAHIMEELFATERQTLRKQLEEQLQAISDADALGKDVELFVMDEDALTATPSSQRRVSQLSQPELSGAQEAMVRSKTLAWRVAMASVVLACGLVAIMFQSQRKSETAPAAKAVAAPRATDNSASTTVHVRIEASPATATATLDGVPIALPFDMRLAQEGRLHHVEVRAEGYRPVSRGISLGEDMSLHIVLEPIDPPRGARTPSRAAPRAQQTVAAPETRAPEPAPAPAPVPEPTQEAPSPPTYRAPPIEHESPY